MLFRQSPSSGSETKQSDKAQLTLDAFGRSQALIEFTPQGQILHANENFLSALGYQLNDIVGQHHRMFVKPEEANSPQYAQFWKDLEVGKFSSGEYERVTRSGETIWISASYNPVHDEDGRVISVVKIASDITETKKRSIDQLAVLEALGSSQAVIEFKPDGTILQANENFLHAVGYALSEISGKHHRIFCDPQYTATQEYQDFWSQLQAGAHSAGRYQRFAKGGKEIWIQATYNPVLGDDGKPYKVVKYATDITAEMHKELAAKQEALGVGQAVASSASEMASTISEISENVSRTARVADDAKASAESSAKHAQNLQQSSEKIGKVVGVIQDLADQTNLLALNATIEAARAGEQGRGFAVVANEVKQLAKATSNETQSIEETVEEIQAGIIDVIGAVEEIQEGVHKVSSNTNTVASAIEEQSITMESLSETASVLVKTEG